MDTTRAVHRVGPGRTVRVLCTLAGLLCAVGVLSGATLRTCENAHHRTTSATALAFVADGHGTSVRGDVHAVAATAVTAAHELRPTGTATTPAGSADTAGVDTERTRGPPVLA